MLQAGQMITQESLWPGSEGCPGSLCSWWSCRCCWSPRSACVQRQCLHTLQGWPNTIISCDDWQIKSVLECMESICKCQPFGQSPLQSSHCLWPSFSTSILSRGQTLTQELPSTTKWATRRKKRTTLLITFRRVRRFTGNVYDPASCQVWNHYFMCYTAKTNMTQVCSIRKIS